MRKFYKKKKRGPVVSKKTTYDGIKFASGLEKHMYKALKDVETEKVNIKIEVIKKYYQ